MPRSYSLDLRRKVTGFVERGYTRREAARVFGVSASFVIRLLASYTRTGRVDAKP